MAGGWPAWAIVKGPSVSEVLSIFRRGIFYHKSECFAGSEIRHSPSRRFVKSPGRIRHDRRELASGWNVGADVFVKGGMFLKHHARVTLGVQNAYGQPQFIDDKLDGHQQVRITAHHNGLIESFPMRVVEQLNREIHIGTLFFGLEHPRE